jgi:hypothetical protein
MPDPPATRRLLLAKEGLCTLAVLALLCFLSALWPLPPVGAGEQAGAAAAPWLFLGLQELLRHLPAWAAGLAVPAVGLSALAAAPWLGPDLRGAEVPTWRRRWHPAEWLAWAVVLGWAGLTVAGAL